MPEKSKKGGLLVFLSVVTLVGIFFFPRMQLASGAKVRLEDITFVFLLGILVLRITQKRLLLYRETLFPLVYFSYGFAVSFIRAVAGIDHFGFYFIIFWAKEFQYFIFFLLFYYLFLQGRIRMIMTAIIILVIANAGVGAYKMVSGVRDCYGIGALFLEDSPSLSGQVYFSCMLFSLFLLYFGFIKGKALRIFLSAIGILSFFACLATGSKSSSFGIITFAVSFWAFHDLASVQDMKRALLQSLKWAGLIIVFVASTYLFYNVLDCRVLGINMGRLRNPVESTMRRYRDDIAPKFKKFKGPADMMFGAGYLAGQHNETKVYFNSAFDSQYARNMLVLGIIGSFIWAVMLWSFGSFLFTFLRAKVFFGALLLSYLAMGIGLESFVMSKSGPVFWILTGIMLAVVRRERRQSDSVGSSTV